MNTFEVRGTDASGKPVVRKYDAATRDDARLAAKVDGISAESVQPVAPKPPVAKTVPAAVPAPASTLPVHANAVPTYRALQILAITLMVIGGLSLVLAAISVAQAKRPAADDEDPLDVRVAAMRQESLYVAAEYRAVMGFAAAGFGASMLALRDIAGNSWRK